MGPWTGGRGEVSPGVSETERSRGSRPLLPPSKRGPLLAGYAGGQRHANNLLVVAHEDAAVGEGGVRPDDRPAEGVVGRVDQVSAADLVIALGTQAGDDQVAVVVEEEKAVAVLDDEHVTAIGLLAVVGLVGRPDALARVHFHAAEF